MTAYNYLKGSYKDGTAKLFSVVADIKMRGSVLRLQLE